MLKMIEMPTVQDDDKNESFRFNAPFSKVHFGTWLLQQEL